MHARARVRLLITWMLDFLLFGTRFFLSFSWKKINAGLSMLYSLCGFEFPITLGCYLVD
jgi:hypothetical protein